MKTKINTLEKAIENQNKKSEAIKDEINQRQIEISNLTNTALSKVKNFFKIRKIQKEQVQSLKAYNQLQNNALTSNLEKSIQELNEMSPQKPIEYEATQNIELRVSEKLGSLLNLENKVTTLRVVDRRGDETNFNTEEIFSTHDVNHATVDYILEEIEALGIEVPKYNKFSMQDELAVGIFEGVIRSPKVEKGGEIFREVSKEIIETTPEQALEVSSNYVILGMEFNEPLRKAIANHLGETDSRFQSLYPTVQAALKETIPATLSGENHWLNDLYIEHGVGDLATVVPEMAQVKLAFKEFFNSISESDTDPNKETFLVADKLFTNPTAALESSTNVGKISTFDSLQPNNPNLSPEENTKIKTVITKIKESSLNYTKIIEQIGLTPGDLNNDGDFYRDYYPNEIKQLNTLKSEVSNLLKDNQDILIDNVGTYYGFSTINNK